MAKEYAKSFYKSKAWEETRKAFLISKHHICERCGDYAVIVHHKTYITKKNINNPEVTLSFKNLEAVCQDCHNKIHHSADKQKRRYFFDENGNIILNG